MCLDLGPDRLRHLALVLTARCGDAFVSLSHIAIWTFHYDQLKKSHVKRVGSWAGSIHSSWARSQINGFSLRSRSPVGLGAWVSSPYRKSECCQRLKRLLVAFFRLFQTECADDRKRCRGG